MVDKTFLKGFLGWLETASNEELLKRKKEAEQKLALFRDPQVRSDCRFLIRLIEQELFARR